MVPPIPKKYYPLFKYQAILIGCRRVRAAFGGLYHTRVHNVSDRGFYGILKYSEVKVEILLSFPLVHLFLPLCSSVAAMLLPKPILLIPPLLGLCTAAEQSPLTKHTETNTTLEEDTSAFIFTSLQGLLSQWANVYAPTGFSVVPGVIPPQTLLYHARPDGDAPPKMEWLAFDSFVSLLVFSPSPFRSTCN